MPMRNYKVKKPFQIHNGPLLPVGTSAININENIIHGNYFMCLVGSEHAHQCLVGNDDECWVKRSALIDDINSLIACEDVLKEQGQEYKFDLKEARLESLWSYSRALRYCRGGKIETDSWLWSNEFYCAKIGDLEKIKNMLINVKP